MNPYTLFASTFSAILIITKKMCCSYYIKNVSENKKNRYILNLMREEQKNKIRQEYPLVSVLIATYNRGKLLTERTIPSVLNQTYQNFEIIIVGDHCTDNTDKLIKDLGDKRIRFYNLPKRGEYPLNPEDRWRVAGVIPRNKALEMCSGDWIATLDDDDEFSRDHIEVLLNFAIEHDLEMVYGKVEMEIQKNKWIELGSYPLKCGKISHIAAIYSSKLKFIKYDINSWKYMEPADWNFWRRIKGAGAKIGFIDQVVGSHYKEHSQRDI